MVADVIRPVDGREAPGPFTVGRLPRLLVGPGRIAELPAVIAAFGGRALVITGARSFRHGPAWAPLAAGLAAAGIAWDHLPVEGEPSPSLVDAAVADRRASPPDVVVGIGGGSAMDAAKAIAGLLRTGTTALDHLEGVGRGIPYPGPATPFVAVPTTAGTGSEVTKNAVLTGRLAGPGGRPAPGPGGAPPSGAGPAGAPPSGAKPGGAPPSGAKPGGAPADGAPFKKSFRDEALVARVAILDPDLLAGCPPEVVAGDGMDAVTQLLEAFTSTGASPFTDAVARAGLAAAAGALPSWHAATLAGAPAEATAADRAAMSWAACCSGIALANAGLGAVHGIVAALGARFPVPHGTGCGILLAATTRANLDALGAREPGSAALARYAEAGRILAGRPDLADDAARESLVDELEAWTDALALPRLADYGMTAADLPAVVATSRGSGMHTNPALLDDAEISGILAACR